MSNLVKYGTYTPEAAEQDQQDLASGGDFMKLTVGSNVVRILPPPIGRNSPFVKVDQHFVQLPGMSKPASFNCPRAMSRRPCPVCSEADRLKATGNPVDNEKAGEYFPRKRVFMNVIDRRQPEQGPRILPVGKQVGETLSDLRKDPVAGADYCDPVSGYDIVIKRDGTGLDTKYDVKMARNSSPLADSVDQMNDWIQVQTDLSRYARVPSTEELNRILSMRPTVDARPAPAAPPARQSRPRTAGDDLDASDEE